MTRFVIAPDVALYLAERAAVIPAQHQLVAPTLLRSQVLALLFVKVQRGELDRKQAERRLDYLRALRIRLLGDRVLQGLAWKVAEKRRFQDTFAAEYIALTQLQADAFVTLDATLADAAKGIVAVAAIDELLGASNGLIDSEADAPGDA
jgi:predicted nucleic acid-binding protein